MKSIYKKQDCCLRSRNVIVLLADNNKLINKSLYNLDNDPSSYDFSVLAKISSFTLLNLKEKYLCKRPKLSVKFRNLIETNTKFLHKENGFSTMSEEMSC
jgi:hypothetical protein